MHVGINAHLLSAQAGYRSAGIHGYIYHTVKALCDLASPDWHFTALLGDGQLPEHPRLTLKRARLNTARPLQRILWEQAVQPISVRGFDVYHAPAFVAPILLNTPSVVTVHDLSFIRYPDSLNFARRNYLQTLTPRSCKAAARVIAVSQSTADDVAELLDIPREKIDVVISGVDEAFHPRSAAEIAAFRTQKQLPERFLFYLGTLEPRKNLPTLIRAYAALPPSMRDEVHLILGGGKGWDYDDIFQTVEQHQLGQRVHFAGYLPADELPLWYNAAEAFVYPSVFEGWGLPVVEAMACACPTIVSDVSSLPEAAGDTGLRVPPHDESAWTAALQHAIHDADWRAKSGAAGIRRAGGFTWRETAQQMLGVYRAAAGGSP